MSQVHTHQRKCSGLQRPSFSRSKRLAVPLPTVGDIVIYFVCQRPRLNEVVIAHLTALTANVHLVCDPNSRVTFIIRFRTMLFAVCNSFSFLCELVFHYVTSKVGLLLLDMVNDVRYHDAKLLLEIKVKVRSCNIFLNHTRFTLFTWFTWLPWLSVGFRFFFRVFHPVGVP